MNGTGGSILGMHASRTKEKTSSHEEDGSYNHKSKEVVDDIKVEW